LQVSLARQRVELSTSTIIFDSPPPPPPPPITILSKLLLLLLLLLLLCWSLLCHSVAEIKKLDLGNLNPIYEREINKPDVHQMKGRWTGGG
jgi:hypothetical protein